MSPATRGVVPTAALEDLLNCKVSIVDVRGLHAKVYISKTGVVVTSANASTNGLGEEGVEISDELEAGYFTERTEDIEAARQWFQKIYNKGKSVTKEHLPEIKTLWKNRRRHRPVRNKDISLLETLEKEPWSLCDRNLGVANARRC